MIDLEKTLRINWLLDFYQYLLTKKQNDYMSLYFHEDFSLQEIANLYQVSRNAIYDSIRKGIKQLENYENKLMLLDKFKKREAIIKQIKDEYACDDKLIHFINQIADLD